MGDKVLYAECFVREEKMKNNYRCPKCGKVPAVTIDYPTHNIHCCDITVRHCGFTVTAFAKWKKICKTFIIKL